MISILYACYLCGLSIFSFFAYYKDKQKAKKGALRSPEKVLLLISLLGGAYGGFTAMQIFRHKTKGEHWYFTAVNLLGIILHTALLLCCIFVFQI